MANNSNTHRKFYFPISFLITLATPFAVYYFYKLILKYSLAFLLKNYGFIIWPIAILLCSGVIAFIVKIILRLRVHRIHYTIHEIDKMSGEEFEALCRNYFQSQNWHVRTTRRTGDYGADLILKRRHHGQTETVVVQCKRYTGKVGQSAIREAYSAINFYGADRAMCITNSFYTPAAKTLAESNDIELLDRYDCERIFSPKSLRF